MNSTTATALQRRLRRTVEGRSGGRWRGGRDGIRHGTERAADRDGRGPAQHDRLDGGARDRARSHGGFRREALFRGVQREQGRGDLLVNNVLGGYERYDYQKFAAPF